MSGQALEYAAQGNGEITIPGSVQNVWGMWHSGIWFSGDAGVMVGLNYLRGFFKP